MKQERLEEAVKAWNKIADACSASNNIYHILNNSKDAKCFYCFEVNRSEWGVTYWLNVDDIICVEVYRKKVDKELSVSPHIEIIDPETEDWDGENYDIREIK